MWYYVFVEAKETKKLKEMKEMTARELYNTCEAGHESLEEFLAALTSALRDEGGVDFSSFPDSDVDEDVLEEINWGL